MSCEDAWREYLAAEARHEAATQKLHKQDGRWASMQEDMVPPFDDEDFRARASLYEASAAAQTAAVEAFALLYEHHRQHAGAAQHPGHDVSVN